MGAFLTYSELKNKAKSQPVASAEEIQQQQMPEYDPNNPMGSFAQIMGPTPAEREAEERRLAENKAKMNAWVGLFNGLGALGKLYYATKGASYAPNNYNPHQQIEANYQAERQRLDALQRNRQAYAQQLYNWQRQADQDQLRRESHEAQMKWYDTRDEMAQQKAELDKLKAVRVIKNKDGSLMKFDPITGTIEPLSEADPLYVEYMNSRINATNKRAGLIGAPVTTTRTNGKGETTTSVRTYGTGGNSKPGGSRGGNKRTTKRRKSATQL